MPEKEKKLRLIGLSTSFVNSNHNRLIYSRIALNDKPYLQAGVG